MTPADVSIARIRHIAGALYGHPSFRAVGLEFADLVNVGWLAAADACERARHPGYVYERARFAMLEARRAQDGRTYRTHDAWVTVDLLDGEALRTLPAARADGSASPVDRLSPAHRAALLEACNRVLAAGARSLVHRLLVDGESLELLAARERVPVQTLRIRRAHAFAKLRAAFQVAA